MLIHWWWADIQGGHLSGRYECLMTATVFCLHSADKTFIGGHSKYITKHHLPPWRGPPTTYYTCGQVSGVNSQIAQSRWRADRRWTKEKISLPHSAWIWLVTCWFHSENQQRQWAITKKCIVNRLYNSTGRLFAHWWIPGRRK